MIVSHFEYQYGVGVEYKALEMLELARARRDMRLDSGMVFFHQALCQAVTELRAGHPSCATCVITGGTSALVPDQARSARHLAQRTRLAAVVINTGSVYTIPALPMVFHRHGAATPPAEGAPPRRGQLPALSAKMVIGAAS